MTGQFDSGSQILYSVRLVLDELPSVVSAAVSASLLDGKLPRVNDAAHAQLFSPPPIRRADELETMELEGRHAEPGINSFYNIFVSYSFPMGLRPLRSGEAVTRVDVKGRRKCHRVDIRRLLPEGDDNPAVRQHAAMNIYGPDTPSIIVASEEMSSPMSSEECHRAWLCPWCAQLMASPDIIHCSHCQRQQPVAKVQDCPMTRTRIFSVHVYHSNVGSSVDWARSQGRLGKTPPNAEHDHSLSYICTVRAIRAHNGGHIRSELLLELLDGNPICKAGPAVIDASSNRPMISQDPKQMDKAGLLLREIVHMLEVESRAWVAAKAFSRLARPSGTYEKTHF